MVHPPHYVIYSPKVGSLSLFMSLSRPPGAYTAYTSAGGGGGGGGGCDDGGDDNDADIAYFVDFLLFFVINYPFFVISPSEIFWWC